MSPVLRDIPTGGVYVTIVSRSPKKGRRRSKTLTVYHVTVDEMTEIVRSAIQANDSKRKAG